MTNHRLVLAAFVLGFLAPGVAVGQGLGDTAARERDKRAKQVVKKATPAFTNEDLEARRPPGQVTTATASSAAAPPTESPAESGPPPLEDRQAEVRPYIENLHQAQARVEAVEARIRQLSTKLNPMSTSFIYGSSGSNSANEELEVRQQLRDAEIELREARTALTAASQAMEDAQRGRAPLIPIPE